MRANALINNGKAHSDRPRNRTTPYLVAADDVPVTARVQSSLDVKSRIYDRGHWLLTP
jgi:hypothetical protein